MLEDRAPQRSAQASTPARRFGAWQHAQPRLPLLIGALVTAAFGALALRLEMRTEFEQLLPEHQPSVVELHRLQEHVSQLSHAYVVLEGGDPARLRAAGDALLPRFLALGPRFVSNAETGVQKGRAFLLARAGLFAQVAALERLRGEVELRFRRAVGRSMGADLGDDPEPPPLDGARVRGILGLESLSGSADRFPDGYYQSKDGKALVVAVRTPVVAGQQDRARATVAAVRGVLDAAERDGLTQGLRVGLAGDLVTGLYEYDAILTDLMKVGALGVALVLLVVLLFFGRLRAVVGLGIAIAAGLVWTFGLAWLLVGHLNVATGFLVSIVAGNGINFGIIWMGRYLELRRGGLPAREALLEAHDSTWSATLVVALAAGAAYSALAATDFRGFRDFAFIGGGGMILCWLATALVLPPAVVLIDRRLPLDAAVRGPLAGLRARGARFEAPFVAAVARAPRALAWAGAVALAAGAALGLWYLRSDPLEYDMRKLQSRVESSGDLYRSAGKALQVMGSGVEGAMVVLVDRPEQVAQLRAILLQRRAAAPAGDPPFQAVDALQDFVPDRQSEKIPLLLTIRARLLRARELRAIPDRDWSELLPLLPPADLRPFGLADLPEDIARPFTEKDGTRGRLVVIEQSETRSDSDLRYLLRWADSFRETRLADGSLVRGSGRAVIFADMLSAVVRDAPRALLVSGALVALWVVLSFGLRRRAFDVLATLLLGLCALFGALQLGGVRLNFLNFMALPITLGVGVDYAVNLAARAARDRDPLEALRHVGGPVALCSLTTILGYLALLESINQGVRSLGLVAVLGEVCCLLAALLVLPAALVLRARAAKRGAA